MGGLCWATWATLAFSVPCLRYLFIAVAVTGAIENLIKSSGLHPSMKGNLGEVSDRTDCRAIFIGRGRKVKFGDGNKSETAIAYCVRWEMKGFCVNWFL